MNPVIKKGGFPMNSYKKISIYIKDFLFQSIIFYLTLLSPLGSLGWKLGVFEKPMYYDIIYESKRSSLPILISHTYYFFLFYFGSFLLSAFPIMCNIYFIRINKFRLFENDFILLKVLFMISANLAYLYICMFLYSELIYRDFLFPLGLTLTIYLIWFFIKVNRNKSENLLS